MFQFHIHHNNRFAGLVACCTMYAYTHDSINIFTCRSPYVTFRQMYPVSASAFIYVHKFFKCTNTSTMSTNLCVWTTHWIQRIWMLNALLVLFFSLLFLFFITKDDAVCTSWICLALNDCRLHNKKKTISPMYSYWWCRNWLISGRLSFWTPFFCIWHSRSMKPNQQSSEIG